MLERLSDLNALVARQLQREGHDTRSIAAALGCRRRLVHDLFTGRTAYEIDPTLEADLQRTWADLPTPEAGEKVQHLRPSKPKGGTRSGPFIRSRVAYVAAPERMETGLRYVLGLIGGDNDDTSKELVGSNG